MMSFSFEFLIIQLIGFIAIPFSILAWISKSRSKILIYQNLNSLFLVINFVLLGAYTGAAMKIVLILRNTVSMNNDKKWAKSKMWMYVFMFLTATLLIVFWQGWISILPVSGVMLGTYAVWRKEPAKMRLYMLVSFAFWIPYTILIHSYSGLISNAITVSAILFGMKKHDKKSDFS